MANVLVLEEGCMCPRKRRVGWWVKAGLPVIFPGFAPQDFQDNSLMINQALLTNLPKKEVNE